MDTPKGIEVAPVDTWQTFWHEKSGVAVLSLTLPNGQSLSFAVPPETAKAMGQALAEVGERALEGRAQQAARPSN